jgi:hypothetical protein
MVVEIVGLEDISRQSIKWGAEGKVAKTLARLERY